MASRAIHFLRTMPSISSRRAPVARISVARFTGSPPTQIVQHGILRRLLLRRAACAPAASLLCPRLQSALAGLGDPVHHLLPHLRHQRQHSAQHLAQRRQIVLADPARELEQLRRDDRLVIEDALDGFRFDRRRLVMQTGHDADQLLIAKRDDNAATQRRRMRRIDAIREMRIEWHRHGDIAEGWHLWRDYQD